MKKALIISVTLFVVLSLVLIYFLSGIRNPETYQTAEMMQSNTKEKPCCSSMDAEKLSDNSIYQLNSVWTTEKGNKIQLSDLKGKKQVMAMIFTNCTYACPLIVNDMKTIESKVKRKDVEFLLISIDPVRDTPETLRKYAENNKLDLNKWTLLTGAEKDITELAAVVGFKFKKERDGSYSHSNLINLLNEEGEIAYQHPGLNQDVQDVLNELK